MSVASEPHPRVGILMGADSDWPVMQVAARISDELGAPYEARVVSAHGMPELLLDHAEIPEPARRLRARFWPGPLTLGSAARAVGLPIP